MAESSNLIAAAYMTEGATNVLGAANQVSAISDRNKFMEKQRKLDLRVGEMQAKDAEARGRESEKRHRQDVKQLIGDQRAALAAQGVEVDSGSAAEIQEQTAELGELDALTIRNNARLEAMGLRIGASQVSIENSLEQMAGYNEARDTLLTGGLRFASSTLRASSYYNSPRTVKKPGNRGGG